jgi:hypothetical protein
LPFFVGYGDESLLNDPKSAHKYKLRIVYWNLGFKITSAMVKIALKPTQTMKMEINSGQIMGESRRSTAPNRDSEPSMSRTLNCHPHFRIFLVIGVSLLGEVIQL